MNAGAETPRLRKEYRIRNYNGVRNGCKLDRGTSGPCSRLRHMSNHNVNGEQLTVWVIVDRLRHTIDLER